MSRKPLSAIVRAPGESYYRAVSRHPERRKIDPARARRQHSEYRQTLAGMVGALVELAAEETYPDGPFTQDCAIVLEDRALLCRPNIGSRRGEIRSVHAALDRLISRIWQVPPPGTLEGGDVLRLGRNILAGRSGRTSDLGIQALRFFAEPMGYHVETIDVPPGVLHLSSAVTVIGDELVVGRQDILEHPAFGSVDAFVVRDGRPEACNVLAVGEHVIVTGDHPVYKDMETMGLTVHRLDLEEFVRADAGPTCLALIVP